MNNMLKTIFVVSVMGGALYGAYVLLNEKEFRSRQAAADTDSAIEGPDISFGQPADEGPWTPPTVDGGVGEGSSHEFPPGDPAAAVTGANPSAPGAFPPANPPAARTTGGMAETTADDVVQSLGASRTFGGAPLASKTSPVPPNTTPVGGGETNSTPVGGGAFETEGVAASNEPGDLALPPDMDPTTGADPGSYALPDDGFQSIDEGAAPEPTQTAGPDFDGAATPLVASSDVPDPGWNETPAPAASGTSEVAGEAARQSYLTAIDTAKAHVAQENYRDALAGLSVVYGNPDLPSPEREELNDLLDALAAKVIYSAEHLHQPPYVVQAGDTLESIASRYAITPEFLARINGLTSLEAPPEPGSSLKVVRGPFRAEVRLRSNLGGSLTLYLGELYAGRFDVELGQDNPPFPGKYTVQDKAIARQFMTAEGAMIPGDAPENPYGGYWIDLGSGISLHGSPATPSPEGRLGCMAVAGEGQAGDLFVILSHASTVEVRR